MPLFALSFQTFPSTKKGHLVIRVPIYRAIASCVIILPFSYPIQKEREDEIITIHVMLAANGANLCGTKSALQKEICALDI